MRLVLLGLVLVFGAFAFVQGNASDPRDATVEGVCAVPAGTGDAGSEDGLRCGDMYPRPSDALLVLQVDFQGAGASGVSFSPSTFAPVDAVLDAERKQVDLASQETAEGVLVVTTLPDGGSMTYLMRHRGLVALTAPGEGLVADLELLAPSDYLMLRFTTAACPVWSEEEGVLREAPLTTGVFAEGRATFVLGQGPEACPDARLTFENLGYWTVV